VRLLFLSLSRVALRQEEQALFIKILNAMLVLCNDCIVEIVQDLIVLLLQQASFNVDSDHGKLVGLYDHRKGFEPNHSVDYHESKLFPFCCDQTQDCSNVEFVIVGPPRKA